MPAGDILRRISRLPSIESASIATDAPLSGNAVFYRVEKQPPINAQAMPRACFHRVSADFFHTLHARLLAGRLFTNDEVHGSANVAIVTENMAKRFWPGPGPIGKRIKVGGLDSPRSRLAMGGRSRGAQESRITRESDTAGPDLFQVFNERSLDFSVLVRTSLEPSAMLPPFARPSPGPSHRCRNSGGFDRRRDGAAPLQRLAAGDLRRHRAGSCHDWSIRRHVVQCFPASGGDWPSHVAGAGYR